MRKMELVQLHALLAEIRRKLAVTYDIPPGTFREYEIHGVGPNQVQRGKDDHKRAINLLRLGIMRVFEDREATNRPRRKMAP